MADADATAFSLMSLGDELTCSICLSPFECPVTLPCGHNFCQECLFATWKDSFSCPQCRTVFAVKPELKKNTVLSTVVETFKVRSGNSEASLHEEESKAQKKKKEVILCDTCMEAEASRTCLTCMASFCELHLRPHRDNPVFRLHQLSEPVGDLLQRICPTHNKLMELFCSQHGHPVCSLCVQQDHKGCSFTSPEEQRSLKEADLRGKLSFLDGKIRKNETVVSQMRDMENKLKDLAVNRQKILSADFQQMRNMLAREERDALAAVDRELESGQLKLRNLTKKFTDNIDKMSKSKEDIHGLLRQSQTQAFLKASFFLPQVACFDPYAPRINLDSRKVLASQACAAALKEHLAEIFNNPVDARVQIIKPGEKAASASGFTPTSPGGHQDSEPQWRSRNPHDPRSLSPGSQFTLSQKKKPSKQSKKSAQLECGMGKRTSSMETLVEFGKDKSRDCSSVAEPKEKPDVVDLSVDRVPAEKRSELLKYGTVLTLDPKTAHKRIALTEGFTKACVSDEPTNYPHSPERFGICSQVLASKGFSRGRHYWEVRLSSSNFIGIGLTYGSIDRKGPTSRLGRNSQSWCVEWFNVKLSAWHNSVETLLVNPNPKRVGVLLDCEEGTATFYNVTDRAYPLHTFVLRITEAVYPAFWIFSSGSSISLCKLQA